MSNPFEELSTPEYSEFIYKSRYARWVDEKGRRENWNETVERYVKFWEEKYPNIPFGTWEDIYSSIFNLQVMPSMRALMTAGPALERDNVAGYNCAMIAIDDQRAFDEIFYILMCGTGAGFSVERQYINKLPKVAEKFYNTETNIVPHDSKIGWATAFRELLSLLYAGKIPKWDFSKIRPAGARLKTFGGRACLTGDTIVYKDRKKERGYNEITISDLFDLQNSAGKWKHKPNHFKDIKLRSLDENTGVFYRNNVLNVIDNGEAPVYEVVTRNGYRIRATDNHRFMDEFGQYTYLSEFIVGDFIAVNGSKEERSGVCIDCGNSCTRRAQRCLSCFNLSQIKDTCLDTTARQRKECREYLGTKCERCGTEKTRLIIHHKDENPKNNNHINLETLCELCHQRHHAKNRTFGNAYSHKYISYDDIISIEYVGVERVYDLTMEAPNHNFVANGFVSHNSGSAPLNELFEFTIEIFKNASGRKLTSVECHDIVCKIAAVVVVGSVRRSALISLSNLSDNRMSVAKSGNWWESNPQRALANNSVCYTEKPEIDIFLKEWLNLYESKSGERGIFSNEAANNLLPARRKELGHTKWGTNPCSLHGDSLLLTTDGYKKFKDLVDKDIEIVNNLGNATKGTVWVSGENKEVIKLIFEGENYEPIICTPDHRFMLLDGSECEATDLLGLRIQLLHSGSVLVQSIEAVGKTTVYDFTEPETHWGVTTNGIVTHNSEIVLRDTGQFCNLTEVIIRPDDTLETLLQKVEIAAIMGTFQATLTDFRYLRQQWKDNCEEERLLGVSLTGIMDHPVLNGSKRHLVFIQEGRDIIYWLETMKQKAIDTNKKWAEILGINQATAVTCTKPSGTVSQLTDTASGIHPRYAPYYTRTVRADVKDPLAKLMMDIGVPNEPDVTKPDSTVIFSFPVKAPECSVFRDDRTAIEQLELWKLYQLYWCEHKPSITVYVKEHEWIAVAAWVYGHFDIVSGVSFLPHSDHSYRQAPYQEITKEQYEEDIKKVKHPDWSELSRYELEDQTTSMKEYACTGGMCEI